MSTSRTQLARQALHAAQRIRVQAKRQLLDPMCIFDVVAELGVDLWFQQNASLEGMYAQTPKARIVIGSERPTGRQRYTCAHELGHHVFGHGTKIDEFKGDHQELQVLDPDEYLAQSFAGFLLMPKLAVANAFKERGWSSSQPTELQAFRIASLFGVGYETLLYHMDLSLGILPKELRIALAKIRLKEIRSALVGESYARSPLIVVDEHWRGRPIDAAVGDFILGPPKCAIEGPNLILVESNHKGTLWTVLYPGRCRLLQPDGNWAAFTRISRKNYEGRAMFRHLPESNEDE